MAEASCHWDSIKAFQFKVRSLEMQVRSSRWLLWLWLLLLQPPEFVKPPMCSQTLEGLGRIWWRRSHHFVWPGDLLQPCRLAGYYRGCHVRALGFQRLEFRGFVGFFRVEVLPLGQSCGGSGHDRQP